VVDVSGPGDLTISDISLTPKWRVFIGEVRPGTSRRTSDQLRWSVSPGEWTVLGVKPSGETVVDLTHVRAMFRLTGEDAPRLIAKLCPLDLDKRMFPDGAAARSLFAAVATELIRDDQGGVRSYLILPSRSFGLFVYETIVDAGEEFGISSALGSPQSE
jgi:heterotetrameric sarcosine oxidase gamma subunit